MAGKKQRQLPGVRNPQVMEAIMETELTPPPDKMERLRAAARELAETDERVKSLKKLLEVTEDRQKELSRRVLPDLFDEVSTDRLGIPEMGVDVVVEPSYFLSIPKDWEPERKDAAFELLAEYGAGDMCSCTVTVYFPKGDVKKARELEKRLRGLNWLGGYDIRLEQSVHWGTATSWLKSHYLDETIEQKIPLEPVNGSVGRVCKVKPRKS